MSAKDGEHSAPPRVWTGVARLVKVEGFVKDEGFLDELFPEWVPGVVVAPLGCND